MRLFLAIDMPQEVRNLLSGLQRHIKGGRPVSEDNLHLTLAFLGDSVANDLAEDLHDALEAKRFRLPRLVIGGVGSFGAASPKAIWIGAGPKVELEDLHGRLAHIARRIGFVLPKRRYQPHVTLVRYSAHDPDAALSLARLLSCSPAATRAEFAPPAFHLYRSYLGQSGPAYEQLASYPFDPN